MEFTVTITKTSQGYTVIDETRNIAAFYSDDDTGRNALVSFLANEVLNAEVNGGRKYR